MKTKNNAGAADAGGNAGQGNIALELARQLDIYLYIVQYMYLFYFALERQHYGGAVGIARVVDQIQYDTIFSQKISEQMKYNIIMLLM